MVKSVVLVLTACLMLLVTGPVNAQETPEPRMVALAGTFQQLLGCAEDWMPDCSTTYMNYDVEDQVWWAYFELPAGDYEYKVAINAAWDPENYGANVTLFGDNIQFSLSKKTGVVFHYDHKTHWISDNVNFPVTTVPGDFQTEVGCYADWDPGCLRSWLQDLDGDGIYIYTSTEIPAGTWEAKVALHEAWDVNYGAGGELYGPDIPFTVAKEGQRVTFSFDSTTHQLAIESGGGLEVAVQPTPAPVKPTPQSIAGSLGSSSPTLDDVQAAMPTSEELGFEADYVFNRDASGQVVIDDLIALYQSVGLDEMADVFTSAKENYGAVGQVVATWDTGSACPSHIQIYSFSFQVMLFTEDQGAMNFAADPAYVQALTQLGVKVKKTDVSLIILGTSTEHACGTVVNYSGLVAYGRYLVITNLLVGSKANLATIPELLDTLNLFMMLEIEEAGLR